MKYITIKFTIQDDTYKVYESYLQDFIQQLPFIDNDLEITELDIPEADE